MRVARYKVDSTEWSEILLLRPIPIRGDPWGDMAVLRGTPWGDLLQTIDGEVLSHALHGYVMPLVRQLGVPPKVLAKRVPKDYRRCAIASQCITASIDCEPGENLPGCYVPPNMDPGAIRAAALVAQAWAEGRYVIIVTGSEFSL